MATPILIVVDSDEEPEDDEPVVLMSSEPTRDKSGQEEAEDDEPVVLMSREPTRDKSGQEEAEDDEPVVLMSREPTRNKSNKNEECVVLMSSEPTRDTTAHHFMEVFSPPRVAVSCRKKGLRAFYSIDELTGYDLLSFEGRAEVLQLVKSTKPLYIMLSPPCTMYSALQTMWNLKKWDELTKKEKFAKADCMLDFSMLLARMQVDSGRY